MRPLLALLLLLWAGAVAAQDLPAQFRVVGVAADDVLNIRAEPRAGATKIGEYGPNAADIEVLRRNAAGTWGMVGRPEGNGWVSLRYLARQEGGTTPIPRPFRCLGTEPFWSLSLNDDASGWSAPEGTEPLDIVEEDAAPDGYFARLKQADGTLRSVTAVNRQCSDGMSDRIYGWQGTVFVAGPGGNRALSGCCTLDGR